MFGLPTPLLVIGGCLAVGALGMLGALFLWGITVKDNKGTFFQDHVMPLLAEGDTDGEFPPHKLGGPLGCHTDDFAAVALQRSHHPTLLDRMMPTYENRTGLDPL